MLERHVDVVRLFGAYAWDPPSPGTATARLRPLPTRNLSAYTPTDKLKPMAAYTRRPGERYGWNWYIPNVNRSSEFRHVAFDANSWKTFVHARLATLAGDKGAMTLFGRKPEQHRLFAEHACLAEASAQAGRRRRELRRHRGPGPDGPRVAAETVQARQPLARLLGPRRAGVAASMAGVKAPGEVASGRQRKRYTQKDLTRRDSWPTL